MRSFCTPASFWSFSCCPPELWGKPACALLAREKKNREGYVSTQRPRPSRGVPHIELQPHARLARPTTTAAAQPPLTCRSCDAPQIRKSFFRQPCRDVTRNTCGPATHLEMSGHANYRTRVAMARASGPLKPRTRQKRTGIRDDIRGRDEARQRQI